MPQECIPGGRERRECQRRCGKENRKAERRICTDPIFQENIREVIESGRPVRSGETSDRRKCERRLGIDRRKSE